MISDGWKWEILMNETDPTKNQHYKFELLFSNSLPFFDCIVSTFYNNIKMYAYLGLRFGCSFHLNKKRIYGTMINFFDVDGSKTASTVSNKYNFFLFKFKNV